MTAEEDKSPFHAPSLERVTHATGVVTLRDTALHSQHGILVAFTERSGGVSTAPFDTLNLAAHVGDDPAVVDANRFRLLEAVGIAQLRDRLITAEQVHGEHVALVDLTYAGSGAFATPGGGGTPPVPATDGLITSATSLPLLMFYADCVPVVLIATRPCRAVAVVHAGWRGTLASLPGSAAAALAGHAGCATGDLLAYIGPHVGPCCYEVDERLLSHFCNIFDTIGAVDGHLDLEGAVRESLTGAGVPAQRIASAGACTRDLTDRFFSYRAQPVTGRHGALAVITEGE